MQPIRFRAKVIRVGTSAGIIIPNDVLKRKNLKIGEKANFSIINTEKERFALLDKVIGSMPNLGPFVRDKMDRLEKFDKQERRIKQIS